MRVPTSVSAPFYPILYIYFIQPTHQYPSSPPDSIASLGFFYFTPSTSYNMLPFNQSPSFFHNAYSSHLSLFLLATSAASSTLICFLNSTLGTLSLGETPHIHCSILISFHSNHPIYFLFMTQVSLSYSITVITHVTYTFPFNFSDTPFTVKIPDSPQLSSCTLASDAEFPPPFSTSPKITELSNSV